MWLRDIPGIEFRTDNEPFKVHFYLNAHFTFSLLLYFLSSVLAVLSSNIQS